ncbi:hypothetical protein HZS_1196, partial [Henneguya salminicola]
MIILSFLISISTFGSIEVKYSHLNSCSCPGSSNNKWDEYCNNNGKKVCGICECFDPWRGDFCECNKTIEESNRLCTPADSNLVCSGKGTCNCGICSCYLQANGPNTVGEYCECGGILCNYFDMKLCGGPKRGECNCNTCQCNPIYSGGNCGEKNCETHCLIFNTPISGPSCVLTKNSFVEYGKDLGKFDFQKLENDNLEIKVKPFRPYIGQIALNRYNSFCSTSFTWDTSSRDILFDHVSLCRLSKQSKYFQERSQFQKFEDERKQATFGGVNI